MPEPKLRASHGGASEPSARTADPRLWVASSYFAEGFPYGLANNLPELVLRTMGADLALVGLTSLLHLPYNLKVLWAPLVERIATKRAWIVGSQVIMGATLLMMALGALVLSQTTSLLVPTLMLLFFVLAFASATSDIAIDGHYLETLNDEEQARYVGLRVLAYRAATTLTRGPVVMILGVVSLWITTGALAVLMGGLALFHVLILPALAPGAHHGRGKQLLPKWLLGLILAVFLLFGGLLVAPKGPGTLAWPAFNWGLLPAYLGGGILLFLVFLSLGKGRKIVAQCLESPSYGPALRSLLTIRDLPIVLSFVILFRTGESLLQKMRYPFLSDVVHFSLAEYGLYSGGFGFFASIAGTTLGGLLIARLGLKRCLWPFLLAQNGLNLLYAVLGPGGAAVSSSHGLARAVLLMDELGSGLGTSVLTVFLMRLCRLEHKATQFALVSGMMSLSFTFAGAASGYLATALGYASFFVFTFFASVPMMALAPRALRAIESEPLP